MYPKQSTKSNPVAAGKLGNGWDHSDDTDHDQCSCIHDIWMH